MDPTASWEGHTQCVTSLVWAEGGEVLSGSWDHAVRKWDAATGVNVDTLYTNKVRRGCEGLGFERRHPARRRGASRV